MPIGPGAEHSPAPGAPRRGEAAAWAGPGLPGPPTGPDDTLFTALADPTRRTIIELLVRDGSGTATGLASELSISRQAAAKHLDRLNESGLAAARRVGRETRYTLDPGPLDEITRWVATVQNQWSQRLDLLRVALDRANPGGPGPGSD